MAAEQTLTPLLTYVIKGSKAYPATTILYNLGNFIEGPVFMVERTNITPVGGLLGDSPINNNFYDCYDRERSFLFTVDGEGYQAIQSGGISS